MPSPFKKLIGDLQDLAKSQTGDAADAAIAAAGATGGDSKNPGGNDSGGTTAAGATGGDADAGGAAAGGKGKPDADDEPLVKSFEVTLENGEKVQVADAGDLIKSLNERVDGMEGEVGEALGMCVDMIKSLVAENVALTAAVKKLAGTGGGRQTVLSILAKAAPASGAGGTAAVVNAAANTIKPQEFLAKAETAFNDHKLSGKDLSLTETCINRGEPIPASIIRQVMAAAA